jgi:predicted nuclease of predicted toxin-antitoxin system
MKIKLDENLPTGLQPILARLGHQVHTAHEEGLTGKPEREIWQAARSQGTNAQVMNPTHRASLLSQKCVG